MNAEPLLRFVNIAADIDNVAELTREARDAAAPFGVTAVSANLILSPSRPGGPDMLIGDDRWRDWRPRYLREVMSRDDPALRMTQLSRSPFTWSQARARYRTRRSEYVMDACRETTGFVDAVVVPLRDTDGTVLTTTFLSPYGDLDPALLNSLWIPGQTYAGRGRDIVTGFSLESDCPLSARQIECLKLVWEGKSDFEIGAILGISPRTVHNHVEGAKHKLKLFKRDLAAREAWRRGWII